MDKNNDFTRVGNFFGENEHRLEIMMAREYLEGDIGMDVWFYPIDHAKSEGDELYSISSASRKITKDPVLLRGHVLIESSKMENNTELVRENFGNLFFTVFNDHLTEKNVQINRGDFFGYQIATDQIKYFEITNPNNTNYNNKRTNKGLRSYYKVVEATPVTDDVFNG